MFDELTFHVNNFHYIFLKILKLWNFFQQKRASIYLKWKHIKVPKVLSSRS